MQEDILYRDASIDDLGQIREILGHYIYNTTTSWSYEVQNRRVLKRWLKSHRNDGWPVQVAVKEGRIVGYACLSRFRDIEGYWPCAENTVYIRPSEKGQGIGRRLMERLFDLAEKKDLQALIAVIDSKNEESIRFHQRFGFETCGKIDGIGWKMGSFRGIDLLKCDLKKNQ